MSSEIPERRAAQYLRDDTDPAECYECAEDPDELHHTSYEPEETVPLCRDCHVEVHSEGEHQLEPDQKRSVGLGSGSDTGDETRAVNVTVPNQTVQWLRETYPEGKSNSERFAMAISDARKFQKFIGSSRL